jgi:hypothetical protein
MYDSVEVGDMFAHPVSQCVEVIAVRHVEFEHWRRRSILRRQTLCNAAH